MGFLVNSRIATEWADWICEGLLLIVGVKTGHLVDSIKSIMYIMIMKGLG